jgi:hypothetical protein
VAGLSSAAQRRPVQTARTTQRRNGMLKAL